MSTALEAIDRDILRPQSSVAVACRGVSKVFGAGDTRTIALRGVDLTVHAGELTLLVGPSGQGFQGAQLFR
jgi:putative ABC transport system ATP-binding protein